MVKIPIVFVCRSLECCLAVIIYFLHQFCNAHVFSHKYAIPHFISPINMSILSTVGIGVATIIDGVSGLGTYEEGVVCYLARVDREMLVVVDMICVS